MYQAEDREGESGSKQRQVPSDLGIKKIYSNHWDQALVANAKIEDNKSEDPIGNLNHTTRMVSEFDDKTDDEERDGWFKE